MTSFRSTADWTVIAARTEVKSVLQLRYIENNGLFESSMAFVNPTVLYPTCIVSFWQQRASTVFGLLSSVQIGKAKTVV